jgi:hypothetical protein
LGLSFPTSGDTIRLEFDRPGCGSTLNEIIIRKEAEQRTGGEFWWGLGTPLGPRVESVAIYITVGFSKFHPFAIASETEHDAASWQFRLPNGTLCRTGRVVEAGKPGWISPAGGRSRF